MNPREAARAIIRARNRFVDTVLAEFENMMRETRAAWAVLSIAAVEAAAVKLSREKAWPTDEYEQERTVQVLANLIAEQWLAEAEAEVGTASAELPVPVRQLLDSMNPENN